MGYINEGELAHLYYDHNISCYSPSPFTNVQFTYYWTGTEIPSTGFAWVFYASVGFENYRWKDDAGSAMAWAVRSTAGDPIPEPASIILFGTGLGAIVLAVRRRRK
jgi:hypothetical protein